MFNNLTKRLSKVLHNINNYKYFTESNIEEVLCEVRTALLEADVALPVIHDFIGHVKNKTIGEKTNKNLTLKQEFIKIVHNELILKMGKSKQDLNLTAQLPSVIMIVGPHGVGKTTSVAKLSKLLHERYKKKTLVVSIDIYRPAAIKQLEILVKHVGVGFFSNNISQKPINIVTMAIKQAKLEFYDILLIDTVGFLHSDRIIMNEIKQIHISIKPIETLFVIDAMIGQDAANIAIEFKKILPLTGIILTKVDSDARGGAALSIHHVTGSPIKFLGTGEKIDALEEFYPERIASRILGMGDILSIIEDIEYRVNKEQVKKLTAKLKSGTNFNLVDFLEQLHGIKKVGSIFNIIDKLPNLGQISDNLKSQIDDKTLVRMEAIINSMTLKERINPKIINDSRKRRIANGCGLQVQDVDRLLKQLDNIRSIIEGIKKREWLK